MSTEHVPLGSRTFLSPPYLRIPLGLVFAVSGCLKFLDLPGFLEALRGLALLPSGILFVASLAVPMTEVILGGMLILNRGARLAAEAVLCLMVLFTIVLVTKLAEGTPVRCGCFGELTSGAVDWTTLLRNVVLVVWSFATALTLARDASKWRSVPDSRAAAAYLVRLIGTASVVALLIVLSAQNRVLKERLEILVDQSLSLQPGDLALPIHGMDTSGHPTTIEFNRHDKCLLYVMKTSCDLCTSNMSTWRALADLALVAGVRVSAVTVDSLLQARAFARQHSIDCDYIASLDRSFLRDYKITTTPQTLLMSNGKVLRVWRGSLSNRDTMEIATLMRSPDGPEQGPGPRKELIQ